jgi:hypothetical protein
VVVTFLLVAGVCIVATIGGVAWLTARGLDPDPMLRLLAQVGGAVFAAATFVMQLANNARSAKTERNTAPLAPDGKPLDLPGELAAVQAAQHRMADALSEVADALPPPARHAYPETVMMPPQERAPGPRGS